MGKMRKSLRKRYSSALLNRMELTCKVQWRDGIYDADYHKFQTIGTVTVPVQNVRSRILGIGWVAINKTPHYKYLEGSTFGDFEYAQYVSYFFGSAALVDSLARFNSLESYLQNRPDRKTLLGGLLRPRDTNVYLVDGSHRAALLVAQGAQELMIDITF